MAGPLNLDNYEIEADESSDELVITHAPTGKTTTLSEDTFEAVITEETTTTRLDAAEPSGAIQPTGKLTFTVEFVDEPFGNPILDPEVVDKKHFDDDEYRVVTGHVDNDNTRLHKTADFNTFEKIADDILPGASGTGQVAGIEFLKDGTVIFFESTDSGTNLWSGPRLTDLSNKGEVVPEPDGGTFYEADAGTIHYYPEDQDTASGVSSDKLSHWTIPDDDLTNATQQSDAFDASQYGFVTGDPEIVEIGDWYYCLTDNPTPSHSDYNIALAAGQTLDSFSLVTPTITRGALGGDITLARRGGYFEALVEYSGGNSTIGHLRAWTVPQNNLIQRGVLPVPTAGPEVIDKRNDETRAEWTFQRNDKAVFKRFVQDSRQEQGRPSGIKIIDNSGNEVGRIVRFDGELRIESPSGGVVGLGIEGSGQQELTVADSDVLINDNVDLSLSTNGARLYVNADGDVVAVDNAGNETILT
jgi:hypothetical protein